MPSCRNVKIDAAREKRFLKYISDGMTESDMGKKESLRADYAGCVKRLIAKKHGLVIKRGYSQVGLTPMSRNVRTRLADYMNILYDTLKMSDEEVSRASGVSKKLLKKAIEVPNKYDWTLSQMERLAKAVDTDFTEFILTLTYDLAKFQQYKTVLRTRLKS